MFEFPYYLRKRTTVRVTSIEEMTSHDHVELPLTSFNSFDYGSDFKNLPQVGYSCQLLYNALNVCLLYTEETMSKVCSL